MEESKPAKSTKRSEISEAEELEFVTQEGRPSKFLRKEELINKQERIEAEIESLRQHELFNNLPLEIKILIASYLLRAPGENPWKQLVNAARNLRNFMTLQKSTLPLLNDMRFNGELIIKLANLYGQNRFAAAFALETPGAAQWLKANIHDEEIKKSAINILQQYEPPRLLSEITRPIDAKAKLIMFILRILSVPDLTGVLKTRLEIWGLEKYIGPKLLEAAAREGDSLVIEKLILAGANTNRYSWDSKFTTPLAIAVDSRYLNAVKQLLKHGADPNPRIKPNEKSEPLFAAVNKGDTQIVNELLRAGANVHHKITGRGDTALTQAVGYGQTEIAKALIEKGANVNQLTYNGTPLMIAAARGDSEMIDILLAANANVNFGRAQQGTPLIQAVRNGNIEIVQKLLNAGANPTITTNRGRTAESFIYELKEPSKIAAMAKLFQEKTRPQTLQKPTLLQRPMLEEAKVAPILSLPAQERSILTFIIPHLNTMRDADGNTPLMLAALHGHEPTIDILLKNPFLINAQNKRGINALMMAAKQGQIGIVKKLLAAGADTTQKDNDGRTALIYAQESNSPHRDSIIQFLTERAQIR